MENTITKFRGFSKKLNCWIEGDLIHTPENKVRIINHTPTSFDGIDSFVIVNELVEPDSVGEFIGITNKKQKDIFEGDILCEYRLDGTYRMYKIFRGKGGFVFNTHQDDFNKPIEQISFTEPCSDMQNAVFLENCEVEGTIFKLN